MNWSRPFRGGQEISSQNLAGAVSALSSDVLRSPESAGYSKQRVIEVNQADQEHAGD